MNDFEKMWRNKVKRNLEIDKDSVLEKIYIDNTKKDPVVYSRKLIKDLKEVMSDEHIQKLFSSCACHMPASNLDKVKEIYEKTGSLKEAHTALQKQFEKDIKSYKQLSDQELQGIVRKGWGAAGILKDDSIIATKIPSAFHKYFKEEDPVKSAYYYCHCPRVRKELLEKKELDSIYCYCGGGFYKNIWETITSKPVRITVLKNLFDNNEVCQFKIEIEGHHY